MYLVLSATTPWAPLPRTWGKVFPPVRRKDQDLDPQAPRTQLTRMAPPVPPALSGAIDSGPKELNEPPPRPQERPQQGQDH